MLTGRLHEVPDQSYGSNFAGYGHPYGDTWGEPPQQYGQVLYDGLGNPVGFLPGIASLLAPLATKAVGALAPLAAKAFRAAAPMISKALPGVAPMISKALPMISQALPMLTQAMPAPTQAMPVATQTFPPPWRVWRRRPARSSYAMGYYGEEATPPANAPLKVQQVTPPPIEPIPAPTPGPAPLGPAPVPISPMPYGPIVVPYPSMRRRRRCRCPRMIRRRLAVPLPPRGPIGDATRAQPASAIQGWGYRGGFNGYGRW
jgi:hypothetical protein